MAGPLAGLTDLYGRALNSPEGELQGTDPAQWGRPADARHATPGGMPDEAFYTNSGTGYGQDPALAAPEVLTAPPAGQAVDRTPISHAAPYPNGIELDKATYAREELPGLHGLDLGAPAHIAIAPMPHPTDITSGFHDSPNTDMLADVPDQIKTTKGTSQGYGTENSYGFQFGHQFRRTQHDPVPYTLTAAGGNGRPFYGHVMPTQANFNVDSPFGAVQGDTSYGMQLQPTPVGPPSPYVQPPDPGVAQAGYAPAYAIDNEWVQI